MVRVLQERYGLRGRDKASRPVLTNEPDRIPEQVAFAF
jgi:hypothetical protein